MGVIILFSLMSVSLMAEPYNLHNQQGGATSGTNHQGVYYSPMPYGAVPQQQDNTMMMFLMMNMMNGQKSQQNEMFPLMFLMMNNMGPQRPVNNGGSMEQMLMLMMFMNKDKKDSDLARR